MKKLIYGWVAAAFFLAAGVAGAQVERTFEGSVVEVHEQGVILSMAGRTIRVHGEPGQYDHLEPGQRVRILATPELEAEGITPIDDTLMEQRMFGTVREIHRDRVSIETLDENIYTVRVPDPRMLRGLQEGENVSVRLQTIPDRSEHWQVEDIQPF